MDRCVDAVDLVVVWERLAKAGGRRVPITKKAAAAWAALAGDIGGGSAGRPRCVRIRRIDVLSVMKARRRRSPPHSQRKTSMWKTRRKRSGHE